MKKIFFIVTGTIITISTMSTPVVAQNMMVEETRSGASSAQNLTEILQNILNKQGIAQLQNIECDKVSESDLEQLGDAWMETIHPGKAHEMMDRMLGGEGSVSLRQAHIQMGRNYLGCNRLINGWSMMGGGWGMLGGSMMAGGGMMGNPGMMSNNSNWTNFYGRNLASGYGVWGIQSWLWLVIELLLIVLLILVILRLLSPKK